MISFLSNTTANKHSFVIAPVVTAELSSTIKEIKN